MVILKCYDLGSIFSDLALGSASHVIPSVGTQFTVLERLEELEQIYLRASLRNGLGLGETRTPLFTGLSARLLKRTFVSPGGLGVPLLTF